ncbi:hypothetical protein ACH4CC_14230 [Streptomyces lydicus]
MLRWPLASRTIHPKATTWVPYATVEANRAIREFMAVRTGRPLWPD